MIGEVVAKLNGTAISSTNPLPNYLSYTFTYNDGTPIANNHLLAVGVTETYKVRVEFKADIENSELPSTEQSSSFSFGISYVQKDENAIAVPHPTTSTVYTINIYDSEHEEDTMVWIGQPIPAAITQYSSAAEAMAALNTLAGGTVAKPIYLKHTISNNTVTESYIEFVITQDLATDNPGMTAGTYTLRGFDTYDEINDACVTECWDSTNNTCLSPYYARNITTLQTAFGVSNCSSGTVSLGEFYSCSAGGLDVNADSSGSVYAIGDSFNCDVSEGGASICGGFLDTDGGGE